MANSPLQSPITPHFFKPLLPDFTNHLDIPVAFFSKHIKGISNNGNTAKLRSDASEITWKVKINGRRLCDGWKDFAVAHDLRLGDIVVFRHEGDMMFHVTPFGPSCCEIQYAPFCTNDNEDDNTDIIVKTDHSRFVSYVTASNLSRDTRGLPKTFTTPNGVSKNCKDVILINEEGKSWNLDLKYKNSSGEFYMRRGWRSFCEANGQKAGGSFTFELVQNGKTGTPLVLQFCLLDSGNQDKPGRDSRKKEVEKRQNEEVAKAESFSTNSDSDDEDNMKTFSSNKNSLETKSLSYHSRFVSHVTASNLSRDTRDLPKSFTIPNGVSKNCKNVILINEEGKSWNLDLKYKNSSGEFYMRRGWRSFCEANGQKAGGSFTFELVQNGKRGTPLVLQLCLLDGGNQHKVGRDSKKKEVEEQQNEEEAKAESFSTNNDSDDEDNMRKLPRNKKVKTETEDSSFVAFVTAANLSSDTLFLPIPFTRSNGMNNMRSKEIVLMNENDEFWTLTLSRHGSERLYMRRGWKSFCVANGKKVGEFFTFKLVKNDEAPVLQAR